VVPRLVVLGGSRSVLNPSDPGVDGGLFSESSCTTARSTKGQLVRVGAAEHGSRPAGEGEVAAHLHSGGGSEGSGAVVGGDRRGSG
jgi:hypothetical protein